MISPLWLPLAVAGLVKAMVYIRRDPPHLELGIGTETNLANPGPKYVEQNKKATQLHLSRHQNEAGHCPDDGGTGGCEHHPRGRHLRARESFGC